jgi:hypothetical protein
MMKQMFPILYLSVGYDSIICGIFHLVTFTTSIFINLNSITDDTMTLIMYN